MARWVAALALALAACGPIEYVNTVTRACSTAKWSPSWWTRAVEYLRQARIEAASADFQAANRFGRLSEEAAIKARDESLKCAANPDAAQCVGAPAEVPAGGLAPVKDDE
jgi:hypothetical protein